MSTHPTGRIDKGSRRWTVAVHEAAHVVAACDLGWRVLYARIGDDSGEMDDRPPRGLDRAQVANESAVISLAGIAASGRGHWLLPAGCQHDLHDARRSLRHATVSYADARRHAKKIIGSRWGEIERVARHLYRNGAL